MFPWFKNTAPRYQLLEDAIQFCGITYPLTIVDTNVDIKRNIGICIDEFARYISNEYRLADGNPVTKGIDRRHLLPHHLYSMTYSNVGIADVETLRNNILKDDNNSRSYTRFKESMLSILLLCDYEYVQSLKGKYLLALIQDLRAMTNGQELNSLYIDYLQKSFTNLPWLPFMPLYSIAYESLGGTD